MTTALLLLINTKTAKKIISGTKIRLKKLNKHIRFKKKNVNNI